MPHIRRRTGEKRFADLQRFSPFASRSQQRQSFINDVICSEKRFFVLFEPVFGFFVVVIGDDAGKPRARINKNHFSFAFPYKIQSWSRFEKFSPFPSVGDAAISAKISADVFFRTDSASSNSSA